MAAELVQRTRLSADSSAPRAARGLVVTALEAAGVTDAAALRVVVLLTSELVTNAVRHGGGDVVLQVSVTGTSVRVAAQDRSSELPVVRRPGPAEGGGRGVALIDSLATEWGVEPAEGGKTVWFQVQLPPSR